MNNSKDILPSERVKHRRCFIKNEYLRLNCKHSRNCNALFLPARKHMRRGFCVIKHVHSLKCIVNAAQDFFRGYAKIFRTESDILLNHCRHNLIIGILKNHADFFAYIKRF